MDAAVVTDVSEPRLLSACELGDAPAQQVVFGEPAEFGKAGRNGLEHFVVDDRLLGFFRALLRNPAARLEQRRDL
jgi:hypothetical protein